MCDYEADEMQSMQVNVEKRGRELDFIAAK